MSTEKKSFFGVMKSYNKNFRVASVMELFERWAWYGLFAVLALYLTGSTDEGALGFSHIEKGQIMGIVTAILYLLPMITGVIADKIGYKLIFNNCLCPVNVWLLCNGRSNIVYYGIYCVFMGCSWCSYV